MKRKIFIALYCAMFALLLAGCQLAREDSGGAAAEERMIGVFITTEHLDLFDFEGCFNDNLNRLSGGEIKMDGSTEQYQGRIYATLTTKTLTNEETGEKSEIQDYVFEDIEGISYYSARMPAFAGSDSYYSSTSDDGISDGHMAISERDDGRTTTLEGTIYVLPMNAGVYYFNPVYQSADGSVYLVSGGGISASGVHDEGPTMSQTLSSDLIVTENGKAQTDSFSVTIAVSFISAPEKIAILQMDADNALISGTKYASDEMPESFVPDYRTEYIIMETHKRSADGEVTIRREIFGRGAETLEYFVVREDGICIKRPLRIEWVEHPDMV